MTDIETKPQFPLWYRPYMLLPVLLFLYIGIPGKWDFSPHVLTHSMPWFLVGASDWGVSNIYAFTKLAFWLGLILGAVANAGVRQPDNMDMFDSVFWRLILNKWHLGAAGLLTVAIFPMMGGYGDDDARDLWILSAYFLVGCTTILILHAYAQLHVWPKHKGMIITLLVAIAWGFLRVSLQHP